jgi:GPH family glycoside/pentoside/hexuronide:cation symporter
MFATGVFFAAGWMYWLALRPVFGGEIYGIRWVAGGMAVLIIGTAMVCVAICRERFTRSNRQHTPILPAIRTTLKNKPFVVLLVFKLCQVFGDRVYGGLLTYVGIYYVCAGNKGNATWYTGIGSGIGTLLSLAMVPFMKRVSQKIGKRNGLVVASLISFGLAVLQPFILRPTMPYLLVIPQMILLPLIMLANTLGTAIVPDICDLDELHTGQRREGLFTAVMGFVQKLEISLTVLIVGYLVSFSGFDSKLTTQPQEVLHKLLWLATLPYIAFTAVTVVTAWMFPMTEASMADVRRQLDERRVREAELAEPALV